MDYYEKRQKCSILIEKLVAINNLTREDISFEILKKTGFSEKFVNKYIDLSLDRGIFKKKGEKICLV